MIGPSTRGLLDRLAVDGERASAASSSEANSKRTSRAAASKVVMAAPSLIPVTSMSTRVAR